MKRLLLIALLLLASSAWAAEPLETSAYITTTSKGAGSLSCGVFMQYKAENNSDAMDLHVQWVWGYLSAYSYRSFFIKGPKVMEKPRGEISPFPDSPTILLFLEKHCREYPLDSVQKGTNRLIKELGGDIIIWKR